MDTVDIAVAAMVYMRLRDIFAKNIFIRDEVFRLTEPGELTALKDSSLPIPLILDSTVPIARMTIGRMRICCKIINQREMKTIGHRTFRRRKARPLSFMLPKTKFVPSLAKPSSFRTSRRSPSIKQTNVRVQEEPGQQNFNDKQLNDITNTNLLRLG